MQQSFSGPLKAPGTPCLLSVFENLINDWEGKKEDPTYFSVKGALIAGIVLLGKYYDATDESPLTVLGTCMYLLLHVTNTHQTSISSQSHYKRCIHQTLFHVEIPGACYGKHP